MEIKRWVPKVTPQKNAGLERLERLEGGKPLEGGKMQLEISLF